MKYFSVFQMKNGTIYDEGSRNSWIDEIVLKHPMLNDNKFLFINWLNIWFILPGNNTLQWTGCKFISMIFIISIAFTHFRLPSDNVSLGWHSEGNLSGMILWKHDINSFTAPWTGGQCPMCIRTSFVFSVSTNHLNVFERNIKNYKLYSCKILFS